MDANERESTSEVVEKNEKSTAQPIFPSSSSRQQLVHLFLAIGLTSSAGEMAEAKSKKRSPPSEETFYEVTKLAIARPNYSKCARYNWENKRDFRRIRRDCEFWNPRNDGIQLLRVKKADLEKLLSPHISVKEIGRMDPNFVKYAKKGTYFRVKTKN